MKALEEENVALKKKVAELEKELREKNNAYDTL